MAPIRRATFHEKKRKKVLANSWWLQNGYELGWAEKVSNPSQPFPPMTSEAYWKESTRFMAARLVCILLHSLLARSRRCLTRFPKMNFFLQTSCRELVVEKRNRSEFHRFIWVLMRNLPMLWGYVICRVRYRGFKFMWLELKLTPFCWNQHKDKPMKLVFARFGTEIRHMKKHSWT
jgi:hypothetical protein